MKVGQAHGWQQKKATNKIACGKEGKGGLVKNQMLQIVICMVTWWSIAPSHLKWIKSPPKVKKSFNVDLKLR